MNGVPKPHIERDALPAVRRVTLCRILASLWPYRRRAAMVVAAVLVGAGLNLLLPWFAKVAVDEAIPQGDLTALWLCSIGMLAGPLVAGALQLAHKYGAESIAQGLMVDLRVALYGRLHEMPFAFFTEQKSGKAVSHVLNDVQGVGSVVSGTLPDMVENAITLLFTAAFLLFLDWRLALVALATLPLSLVPVRSVGLRRKTLKRQAQAQVGELTALLMEMLSVSGALLVKAFGAERREVDRLRAKAQDVARLSLQQALVGRTSRVLLGGVEALGPALLFAVGGALVMGGHIGLGTIVAFVTVLKRLYGPATKLATVQMDLLTSYAYYERVFAVLDHTPAIASPPDAVVLDAVDGRVELRDVSFSYDGKTPAVSRISLTIEAGQTVALVGPSGSGKSTLAALLLRLYDPTSGSVLVDGVDVRRVDLASLRGAIGVVTQDTFLVHGTILENLRYGCASSTQEEVEDAARRAQIHDVIAALPLGYDTVVGERGYRFSAGERQRIAIARAILKDPRILILDEATSALDAVSERRVQAAFAELRAGRTTLVIAHRLSMVRDADQIVVLDGGRIVERATHDELLAQRGLYSGLWQTQTSQRVGRSAA
jgi:ATP-binding cassette subfamily B protein